MIQEEKELLFKDLCARLPYHVKVKVWCRDGMEEEGELDLEHNYGDVLKDAFYFNDIVDIKPYLRPLSSMTEDEERIFEQLTKDCHYKPRPSVIAKFFDWLNALHFDCRGLFEKGLALEAPKGMYNE